MRRNPRSESCNGKKNLHELSDAHYTENTNSLLYEHFQGKQDARTQRSEVDVISKIINPNHLSTDTYRRNITQSCYL